MLLIRQAIRVHLTHVSVCFKAASHSCLILQAYGNVRASREFVGHSIANVRCWFHEA